MRLLQTLSLALLLGVAPALAQSSSVPEGTPPAPDSVVPEDLQPFVGDWLLEQEDESAPRCPIRLLDAEAIGGYAVELPEPCPAPYPADRIAAWNVDETNAVLLLDAERHVVIRLEEDEDGLYDTPEGSTPRFYLLSPYDEDGAGGEQDSE